MTDYDIRKAVGEGVKASNGFVQWEKTVDFATFNLGANDRAEFLTLRAGFVFSRCDVFLLTAEGGAATIDIGDGSTAKLFMDAGDVNGTPNAHIANGAGATAAAGQVFAADTPVYIKALAAVDAAKVKVVFTGYVTVLG